MLIANDLYIMRGGKQVVANIDVALTPGQKCSACWAPMVLAKVRCWLPCAASLPRPAARCCWTAIALNQWSGPQRARRLAVLPQSSTLDFAFRVEEVVAMGRLPHGSGQQRDGEIVAAALAAADGLHLLRSQLSDAVGRRASAGASGAGAGSGVAGRGGPDVYCWTNPRRRSTRCISTPRSAGRSRVRRTWWRGDGHPA